MKISPGGRSLKEQGSEETGEFYRGLSKGWKGYADIFKQIIHTPLPIKLNISKTWEVGMD